jgi:threonine/homoserine/homoserine lactone efflux protein
MTESVTIWIYLLSGITFGFAAAAQPGPLSIYLISRTLQSGWKRTLPAIFAPLISDGPIAVVCLLILGNLPPDLLQYIRIAGGLFILYLAFRAAVAWYKRKDSIQITEVSARRTLFDATVVNS